MASPIDYQACTDESLGLLAEHAREESVRELAKSEVARRAGERAHRAMLLEIARMHCSSGIKALEARNSDGHDFFECSVWGLGAALEAAYQVGRVEACRDFVASLEGLPKGAR